MSNSYKNTPAVIAFWEAFLRWDDQVAPDTPYEAWFFGDTRELANELTELVLSGKKTATASLYWEYEADREALPLEDSYSVITDFDGNPRGIIQSTEIRILPFEEVEADFAKEEGEGDLSLDYWRQAHVSFFSRTCTRIGLEPDLKMPVVCERFRLVYVGL